MVKYLQEKKGSPIFWDFLFLFILIFLVFLKYREYVFGDKLFGPFVDTVNIIAPLFSNIDRIIDNGEAPMWLSTVLDGLPIYHSPLVSPHYPFYFFHCIDYDIGFKTMRIIASLKVLHFIPCLVGYYMINRLLNIKPVYAFLGTLVFLSIAYLALSIKWVNWFVPYSWYPLFLSSLILIYNKERFGVGLLVLFLSTFGVSATSTGVIYPFYIALFYGLCEIAFSERKLNLLIVSLVAAVGVLIIASPSLIPIFLESENLLRKLGTGYPAVVGSQTIPVELYTPQLSFSTIHDFVSFSHITRYKSVSHPFIGSFGLFGGVLGILLMTLNKFKINSRIPWLFLLGLGLWSFLISHGNDTGFIELHQIIPLLNKLRHSINHIYWFLFVLPLFFGWLTQYILSEQVSFLKQKNSLAFCIGLISLLGVLFASFVEINQYTYFFFLFFIFVLAGRVVFKSYDTAVVLVSKILVIIICVFQFQNHYRTDFAIGAYGYFDEDNIDSMTALKEISSLLGDEVNDYRIMYTSKETNDAKYAMNGSYFGLRSFQGRHVPLLADQYKFKYNKDKNLNLRRLLGTRFEFSDARIADPLGDSIVWSKNGKILTIDTTATSRLYPVNNIEYYSDYSSFIQKVKSTEPSKNLAFLSSALRNEYGSEFIDFKGEIYKTSSNSYNDIRYKIITETPQLFVWNEHFNNNWSIIANNEKVETFKINFTQVGFSLPKGIYELSFKYENKLYSFLILVRNLFVLFLLVVVLLYYSNKKMKFTSLF